MHHTACSRPRCPCPRVVALHHTATTVDQLLSVAARWCGKRKREKEQSRAEQRRAEKRREEKNKRVAHTLQPRRATQRDVSHRPPTREPRTRVALPPLSPSPSPSPRLPTPPSPSARVRNTHRVNNGPAPPNGQSRPRHRIATQAAVIRSTRRWRSVASTPIESK